MAKALSTKFTNIIDANYTNTVGLQAVQSQFNRSPQLTWLSGFGLNQADRIYTAAMNIAASGTSDLDLAGSLLDTFGDVLTFARIKAIVVIADPTNINNIIMGNAAANQFPGPFGAVTHTVAVKPGGIMMLLAPDATAWPVTAGTADILRFANSGAGSAVLFDLALIGASA